MAKAKNGSIFRRTKKLPSGEKITLPMWWIKYYKDGKPYRESSGSERHDDAARLLKRRLGEIATGRFAGLGPERIRFRELAEDVIEDYKQNGHRSLAHVQCRLKHLLPALGDVRAADFGTAHLKKYVQDRRDKEAANATINRELALIKRASRLAARCDPPKVVRVPHVPMLKENNVRKGFLEHADCVKLRNALPEAIRPLFVVLYHVGGRVGEMKSLEWRQVDLNALRITLDPGTTKNGGGRTLPIYADMVEWLKIEKEIRDQDYPDCPYVFRRGGKPIKDFEDSLIAATAAAGVPGVLVHDLRRSAIRNMVRAGVPEKIAMQVSGHKTRSVFDRYNIVNEGDLRLFTSKMDAHLESLEEEAPVSPPTGTPTGTPAHSEPNQEQAKKRVSRLN